MMSGAGAQARIGVQHFFLFVIFLILDAKLLRSRNINHMINKKRLICDATTTWKKLRLQFGNNKYPERSRQQKTSK